MAPFNLKFVSYVPPASSGNPEGSGSAPELAPKRARGRPKGSKNKPKDGCFEQPVATATSMSAQRGIIVNPTDFALASIPSPARCNDDAQLAVPVLPRNVPAVSLENTITPADTTLDTHPSSVRCDVDAQNVASAQNLDAGLGLSNTAIRPVNAALTSNLGTARCNVDAQTAPSMHLPDASAQPSRNMDVAAPAHHFHPSTARRDIDAQTISSSTQPPHTAPSRRAGAPATASNMARGRGVVDRARVQPDVDTGTLAPPSLPSASSTPELSPLGLITDVENESNLSSFLSGGIGQDEEPDSEPNGAASRSERVPFPEWFQNRVNTLLEELRHDLKPLGGQSRHYKEGQFWIRPKSVWSSLGGISLKPTDLYSPKFFLWDPLSLLGKTYTLRCPDCNHYLTRGGVVERPRRVVDVDSTFWLIGYTYECQIIATGGCNARFRSWDQRILQRLPRALAAEFPARLTWRSGLSTRAFGVVRSCFQHGMGSEEVADMFRMQHLRRYDELRLQYLRTKIGQIGISPAYEPFLPFEDRSTRGFHGFTPSGQWLRDMYDEFIESHRDTMNQHMAMRSAEICAIDHSHKIAKHIFKVDGVPIFTALLTVTNEKAEIRVCIFVATKSQSQYEEALRRHANELPIYGHQLPQLFYTDNITDKPMLEKIYDSLRVGVVPVEKYSYLPMFASPGFVRQPEQLDTQVSINNVMRSLCDEIPAGGHIVIGFDSEWNVDVAPHGRLTGQGPPAIAQIAYKDRVYVLRIGEMLSRKALPAELVNLLRSPQVIKAGRQVNGDLRRLAVAAGHPPNQFCGALDLAAFAKDRFLVTTATLSLADLFAAIFQQCLPKNDTERVSSNWSDTELTAAQLEYAARDAYASLLLYHEINKTPLPLPFSPTQTLPHGTPVLLLTDDNKKLAARGVISVLASEEKFNGENLTKTRTVITVGEIVVPGAIIAQNREKGTGRKLALQDLGSIPFDILAHRSHVRIRPIVSAADTNMADCLIPETPELDNSPPVDPQTPMDEHGVEMISVTEGLNIADSDAEESGGSPQQSREPDTASAAEGETVLGPAALPAHARLIRSRVLKDIFHVFHMIYISRTHGLRQEFCQALRDAMLIPHPADKALIEVYLKSQNVTWDNMRQYHPKWLWRHCRRTIPPAEQLYPVVHQVFTTYGALKDAKTGLPLFNTAAWKIAKNILELIKNGYVSDPPGVQLYFCLGFDQKAGGLPIYRCQRGTNDVEGAVHTHLLSNLPSHGASVRHMVACLLDFVLCHNLRVGHFNSTGHKYLGHDSIWLLNEIQELEIVLGESYDRLPAQLAWINGNLYKKTEQSAGILQIPKSVRELAKIQPFNRETDSKQKQAYLAKMQGTRKPVLPVHTIAEKQLFAELMRTSPTFHKCSTSISLAAVEIWNQKAESTTDIYYKLEEQLTAYLNGSYKDSANIRQSCAQARDQTKALRVSLQDPQRTKKIMNVTSGPLVQLQVNTGFEESAGATSSTASPSQIVQFAETRNVPLAAAKATIDISRKRAASGEPAGRPPSKQPKTRTCVRCGTTEGCNGRQYWYKCTNACRDCNKHGVLQCAGRSSKRPNVRRCVAAKDLDPDDLSQAARSALGLGFASASQSRLSFNRNSTTQSN
ncbi:hypothetical protein C8R47DRAFT_1029405 [Mycena vitilis]|nr:hypothetical protein C8R47DRAFT_1060534 [Mycena vitilis]KAJ6456288.1 hypothetical protein C8R47DRAFT_1029405 [Mycena vitilis]